MNKKSVINTGTLLILVVIILTFSLYSISSKGSTDEYQYLLEDADEDQYFLPEDIINSGGEPGLLMSLTESNGTFFDGFESGLFSTNNWSLYGTGRNWTVATTNPMSGTYHAQSQRSGAGKPSYIQANISTIGYMNITFTYYRKLVGLDSADEFSAEWYDGIGWTAIERLNKANDASYVYKTFDLPSAAEQNANFAIRFMCEAGAVSEYCRVDNVEIKGNIAPNNPTLKLNFTYDSLNYTNESMWCEIYVDDPDAENDMGIDITIMNSTTNDISTAVEQYTLLSAFTGLTEPAYVQFEIKEQNFTKGDYVWCQARVYDQKIYSDWVNSTYLKVENYPIKISGPIIVEDDISPPENQVDLTAGSTELVTCTATTTDADGYEDVTSASAFFYDIGEGKTWDSPDDNSSHYTNNTCYLSNGIGDAKDVACTFELWYYANNSTWKCNITATDNGNSNDSGVDDTQILDLIALDVPTMLDYGILDPGDTSTERIITVTNAGNTKIDIGLDGYGLYDGDGNAMGCIKENNISLSYERYNVSESGVDYDTEMMPLTDASVVQPDFNLLERSDSGNSTKNTYWKLKVPTGVGGTCQGVITVLAVSG